MSPDSAFISSSRCSYSGAPFSKSQGSHRGSDFRRTRLVLFVILQLALFAAVSNTAAVLHSSNEKWPSCALDESRNCGATPQRPLPKGSVIVEPAAQLLAEPARIL